METLGKPTTGSVNAAIDEYDRIGHTQFLEKYATGRAPKAHYLRVNERLYPLKALWAAAHRPPIQTSKTHTRRANSGMIALGFKNVVQGDVAEQYEEGELIVQEIASLTRNPHLVAAAKAKFGLKCKACNFDFGQYYGKLGDGYIECHHLKPLSTRGGVSGPSRLEDLTVLCSNCHRMAHRRNPPLTLNELISTIQSAARLLDS